MARDIAFAQLGEGQREPFGIADLARELESQFLLQEGLVQVTQCAGGIGGMGERLNVAFRLAGLVVEPRGFFPCDECLFQRPLLRPRCMSSSAEGPPSAANATVQESRKTRQRLNACGIGAGALDAIAHSLCRNRII